jgi:hypothetical protein
MMVVALAYNLQVAESILLMSDFWGQEPPKGKVIFKLTPLRDFKGWGARGLARQG